MPDERRVAGEEGNCHRDVKHRDIVNNTVITVYRVPGGD